MVLLGIVQKVRDGEALILGNADMLHRLRQDFLLAASRNVFQVPDRHILELIQIDMDVAG